MFTQTPKNRVTFRRSLTSLMLGVLSIATILYGGFAYHSQKAYAATNSTINFQARLEGSGGAIAPDGYYNIEFKLYSASTGGSALWTEDYYDANGPVAGLDNRVKVVNGYVTVSLGSQTAFPNTINWDQNMYLTMNIGGTTQTATPTYDGEMSPRLALTAVPYAFKAGQLVTGNGTLSSTLSLIQPTVGNQVFQVNDQGAAGTYNLCVQGATTANGGCAASTGGSGYIQNQNASAQTSSNFWISGTGIAATALQAPSFDTPSAAALNIGTTNATSVTVGKTGVNTFVGGNLSVGTTQSLGAITVANGAWISSVDSTGTGTVNEFSVNSNNQIQVGAALSVDGGIILPTDGGQLTLSDLPIDSSAASGTKESYSLRVGSTNALTVYGEADGSGNSQNIRVAIGSSIAPGYTLDVGGDVNTSGAYRTGTTTVINASGVLQTASLTGTYGSLTGVGTLTAGTWNASTIGVQYGGTGLTSYTVGDLLYASGTTTIGKLSDVATGSCLKSGGTGTAPTWGTCSGGTGVTLQGTTPGTPDSGNINVSGTIIAGTGLQSSGLDTAAAGALTIGNATATSVSVGNASGATSVAIKAGTGGVTIASGGIGNTVQIGNTSGAVSQTINIGTNATAASTNAISIGSTVGSTVTLQSSTTKLQNSATGILVQTSTNSSTAFQVQDSVGSPIFIVDTTTAVNLLAYAGFEVGNPPTGWSANGAATISQNSNKANTYHGLYSLQLVTSGANQGANTSAFTQTVTSGTYNVSFYAMLSSGTMAGNLFAVTSTDGTTHTCNPTAAPGLTATGFTRLSCSFTTTGNMTNLAITQTDATARTIYIDAVQLQSGSTVSAYQIGAIQLRGVVTNPAAFQSSSNSTSAFQIQNATGTSNLFIADTLNNRIGIGTATPGYTLDVNGTINSNSVISATGTTGLNETTTTSGTYLGTTGGTPRILLATGTATQNIEFDNILGTLRIYNPSSTPKFTIDANSRTVINGSSTASQFQVNVQNPGYVGSLIQGVSGQTADLQQIWSANNTSNPVAKFNAQGGLTLGTLGGTTGYAGQLSFGDGTTDGYTATLQTGTLTANQILTIQNLTGTLAVVQSGTPGTAQTGNINVSGTIIGAAGLQAPSLDAATSGALTIGGANATSVAITESTSVLSSSATAAAFSILNSNGTTALEVRAGGAGQGNALIGLFAGQHIAGGGNNTALGSYAMQSNSGGDNNTVIGNDALNSSTNANANTAIGSSALVNNVTGSSNVAIGYKSALGLTTGATNTSVGTTSQSYNSTGSNNTALGYNANSTFQVNAAGTLTVSAITTGGSGTNMFTVTGHGYTVGYTACFEVASTGTFPGSMAALVPYCFTVVDANNFSYQGTIASAGSGTITLIPAKQFSNSTAIGANSAVTATNQVVLGDSNIVQVTTSGGINQSGAANGNTFAGAVTANNGLTVAEMQTATSGSVDGIFSNINVTPTATSTANFRSIDGYQYIGGSANLTGATAIGLNGGNEYGGTGTLGATIGANVYTTVDAGATITQAYGLNVGNPAGAGTVANNYGIFVNSQTKGATSNYGLYIQGATTNALYVAAGATFLGGATTVSTNIYTPSIDGVGASSTLAVGGVNATTINVGTAVATAINVGNTSSALTLQGTSPTLKAAGTGTVTIGATGAGTVTIGNYGVSGGTVTIGSDAFNHAITIGNSTGGSATLAGGTVAITSNTGAGGTFILTGPTWTTTTRGIEIGPTGTQTTPTLLGLNNASTAINSETAGNCTTTVNPGAMYYSTVTATIRACVNGAFEDVVTTAGIGAILFGVVPDSGVTPGDVFAAGNSTKGPCKVSLGAASTTVSWTACTAYTGVSNGTTSNVRKVSVTAGTATASNTTAFASQYLCLSNTTGQPVLSASVAQGQPMTGTGITTTFSAAAPQLCLANIEFATTASTIGWINDTRVFTTTTKQFVNVIGSTAPFVGGVVSNPSSTADEYTMSDTSGTANVAGVVVSASSNSTTAGTINALIATAGPVGVLATGTATIGTIIHTGTSSVGIAVVGTASSTAYANLGFAYNTMSNSCTLNANTCVSSEDTILNIK